MNAHDKLSPHSLPMAAGEIQSWTLPPKTAADFAPPPKRMNAFGYFLAMLKEMQDADIGTLVEAEAEFDAFTSKDHKIRLGLDEESWSQTLKDACTTLLGNKVEAHYGEGQIDQFVTKYGDVR